VTARPGPSVAQQSVALGDHVHARAQPLSVDTGAIQDDAVTADKLANALFGGTPSTIDPDDTASNGSGQVFALSDHQHAATAGTPDGLTKTATSAENNGSTWARNNHTHATSTLPWGIVARQTLTANSSTFTGDATTDFALASVAVDAARLYRVCLNTAWQASGDARWLVNFHVGGTLTARIGDINPSAAADGDGMLFGAFLWEPSTGTVNVDIRVDEITAAVDLLFAAGATSPRQFWIEDIGPR